MRLRTCKVCAVDLPLTKFDKAPGCLDGRRPVCRDCRESKPPKAAPPEPPKRFFRPLGGTRFLVTSAQNATPVHAGFLATLQVAAKSLGAELVVIPFRYKNPTSVWSSKQAEAEWWDPAVTPYLHNVRKKLNPNLILCADVKMQPTASSPLSGFESLTGPESCILGHPKMQFKTVAVPSQTYPKILTTTGACTVRNYTDTKAGKIGEFHHYLGGLIVEIDGPLFHIRQLNANRKDGSFYDLDKRYTAAGVTDAGPALALVMGDTHVAVTDPDVDAATFGEWEWDVERADYVPVPNAGPREQVSMVDLLKPKTLVFHDIFDGETVNPHEVGDPFLAEAKRKAGRQDVRAELQGVVDFLRPRAAGRDVVIVDSNHQEFLTRWMRRCDWKQDLRNARLYLETALVLLESAEMTPGGATHGDPFAYWLHKLGAGADVRCLKPGESCLIGGVECSLHGHNGPNGARGSLKNHSRLGRKVFIGHGHGPGIEEGGYQVGTSTPRRLAYQRGASNHLNTHGVIYPDGTRALLTIIGRAWRLAA